MTVLDRIAAAPISWGVCEVPGWGAQMAAGARARRDARAGHPRDRGRARTATSATTRTPPPRSCASHGLRLVGGFVPTVLHRPGALEPVERAARAVRRRGRRRAGGRGRHRRRGLRRAPVALGGRSGPRCCDGLDAARAICAARGLRCALHPHVGTMVEGPRRSTACSARSSVDLCLDTGHLLIGGSDPVALARAAAQRVSHVHLKDVDGALAGARAGRRADLLRRGAGGALPPARRGLGRRRGSSSPCSSAPATPAGTCSSRTRCSTPTRRRRAGPLGDVRAEPRVPALGRSSRRRERAPARRRRRRRAHGSRAPRGAATPAPRASSPPPSSTPTRRARRGIAGTGLPDVRRRRRAPCRPRLATPR